MSDPVNNTPSAAPATPTPDSTTPSATPTQEAAIQEAIRKHKVKVDGQEIEVDEPELINSYQLRKASDKRFQEGMQARKQSEEFVRLLKTDPIKALTHPAIGHDMKKIAEDFLVQQMQEEMMSPEERELKSLRAEVEQARTMKKQEEERARLQEEQAVQERYTQEYQRDIQEALKEGGLPITNFTVKRLISYMSDAIRAGGADQIKAKDLIEFVRQDYIDDTKSLYSGLDSDSLMALLGDDIAEKIRKHDLKKLRTDKKESANELKKGVSSEDKGKKHLTRDEWKKMISERVK